MYSFRNDYSEGAHPSILENLQKTNLVQEEGYGLDHHTLNAQKYILELMDSKSSEVHLISGGTQTNLIAISAFLRPYEACIAPESGHISTHETGAIEATGHKIIEVTAVDGKLTEALIQPKLDEHHFEHMVKPRLVYISNPTELGTVYSKQELIDLYEFCKKKNLLLYCDGARLGAALTADQSLSLKIMANYTDAFFIGATKVGALLGEALIINNPLLQADMRYMIKQRGALLSKGRLLGIQFETLFKDGLYFKLAEHANNMSGLLIKGLKEMGCDFLINSPTNQQFPIFSNVMIEKLSEHYSFYTWQKMNETHSAVRLITSWATEASTIHTFLKKYNSLLKNS